jgi:hypothetical protein
MSPKNAIPTLRGWVHPRTGELLKAQKMTEAQVDAYWAEQVSEPAAPQMLNESPSVERTLDNSEVEHHYGIQRQHYGMEEK